MPIRTRRGRAAAYRSVWEWPLHSPMRLFLCLAAVAVLVIAVTTVAGRLGADGTASSSGPELTDPSSAAPGAPAPDAPAPAPDPVAPEPVPTTLPTAAAPAEALVVAQRWTEAWAATPPGITGAQWSDGLAPYTTEEYLAVLASVDPSNVPDTEVSGPPQAVEVRPEAVRVQVPTRTVRLELLLVQVAPGQWRVSGYDGAS